MDGAETHGAGKVGAGGTVAGASAIPPGSMEAHGGGYIFGRK